MPDETTARKDGARPGDPEVIQKVPCPYLPGRTWWNRVRFVPDLTNEGLRRELDRRYRRAGPYLFRPECEACLSCIPIRVDVEGYTPTKSQRRIARKNRDVAIETDAPTFSFEKYRLFQRYALHQHGRCEADPFDYLISYVVGSVRTLEMRYRIGGRLAGVGIVDDPGEILSSVYFYFDPGEHRRSLGTFSILREIDLARERGHRWLYLGYWVEGCSHMAYKARFRPAEILLDGRWTPLGAGSAGRILEGRLPGSTRARRPGTSPAPDGP